MPSEPKSNSDREVELGYVSGVFGVRGEVRLHLNNSESSLLRKGAPVQLQLADGTRREVWLTARGGAGKRMLGEIRGVTDRDVAASLQGAHIFVPSSLFPKLPDGEFWGWEVEGLPVFLEGSDTQLGEVIALHATPGGDLLAVRTAAGESFIPLLKAFVREVSPQNQRVVLTADALAGDEG